MKKIYALVLGGIFTGSSLCAQSDDPYIWMEEVESERSLNWVKEQNAVTAEKITSVPGFNEMKDRYLEALNDQSKIDYPNVVGDYIYNFWQDENHVRGIWRRTSRQAYLDNTQQWETILDLDKLSEKEDTKWVFKGATWLAPDYTLCLLSLSDGGMDENEIREFDVEKKAFVQGGFYLPSSKGSASWINKDELIVARNFGENSMTTSGYPRMVKTWKRGTKLADAKTIMEGESSLMGIWPYADYVDGKNHIFISKAIGFYEHEDYYLNKGKLVRLGLQPDSDSRGLYRGMLMVKLNSDWNVNGKTFQLGSLVSVNFDKLVSGKTEVKEVYIPDAKSSIDGVSITKDGILLNTLQNVQNVLLSCTYSKKKWTYKTLETPLYGRVSVIGTSRKKSDYFYQYSNFITPSTLYYVSNGKEKIVRQSTQSFQSDHLEVHQYEATSKDGTQIPYFIVHAKNMPYNGENPVLVYAYGGFNISIKPSYDKRAGIGWLEQGGVYVIANIRGGGEFGPSWHQAAKKEKRQNAYNDFYAVCEDLIVKKITTPKHMGAFGWSNGGLMAGVVSTQRPDLFNAVVIGAPLLDMKRFNKMLAGASWMGEYGNPDIPEEWEYIQKYSPYHNISPKTKYPEVFFVTSTKDDRVHPAHARKMASRMMEQGHPIFYYETIEGGHGASSTNEQSAFNQALIFNYLKMKLMH